jgi:hypothetical protein
MALDELATDLYLEHLTEHDLAFLCGFYHDGAPGGDLRGRVRSRRGGIEGFLGSREVFEAVFGAGQNRAVLRVSPFLVFAVAVRRAAHELGSTPFVRDWPGAGRGAPVLDVPRLREFMSTPVHRFFLAELLASYARLASGSVLVATPRGLRRRRFSELDPVQLAGLVEVVEKAERPGVLRRLGDLALFLTGVFPDYVARRGFGPVDQGRLLRVAAVGPGGMRREGAARSDRVRGDDAVALLARLGRRWYEVAARLLPRPLPADVAVIGEMPERFDDARRVLSVVAERFLFPQRDRWFGLPPSY